MKFIFPQNYNFNTKLFGILDYQTTIFNIICWFIIILIAKILKLNLLSKIILFIIICFPILLISMFGFYQENIIYVFKYILKFYTNPQIYLYKKY